MSTTPETAAVADQPARLRGGRADAQLRRRGRGAARHPVGGQPPDQGPRGRARRALFVRGTRYGRRSRPTARRCCARSSPGSPSSTPASSRSAARAAAGASASPPSPRSARSGCCRGSRRSSASHPDIDIRVSAHDAIADLDDPELDLALRYLSPAQRAGRRRAPVRRDARRRWSAAASGSRSGSAQAPPLAQARPTWSASTRSPRKTTTAPSTEFLSWRHWLAAHGQPALRAAALAVPQLHLPAGAGGAGRPRRRAGARAAGVRGAAARRAGRAVRRGRAGRRARSRYWMLVAPASRARPR